VRKFGAYSEKSAICRQDANFGTPHGQPEHWLGRFGQGEERAAVLELVLLVPRITVISGIDVEVR
jgi:hypothetical protein